jgi:PPP family 3-phenylpropionic acid transporter
MTATARLAAYYFAFFAHAGVFVPYFTLWLADRALSAAQIALVVAMPQAARIFAPALWGWLADRSGARKGIVVFSGFALLAGYAALYGAGSFAGIATLVLALSVLSAGALPIVETLTMSVLGGRGERYGPVRLWGSIGFILAVLGVGAWLDYRPPSTVLAWILGLAALSWAVSFALPEARAGAGPEGETRLGEALSRPGVLALFGACFCMVAAHGALYAFYSLYLQAQGYSTTLIGALWTLGVVAEIGMFLLLPQLMRRFPLRALLAASFACAVARFLAIGWGVESLAVLAAAQLLHAATFGTYHAAAVAAVHKLFPGSLAARGQALYSSIGFGLGGAIGILLAGWTWGALGPGLSFTLSSGFGLAGLLLVAWRVRV